MVYSRTNMPRYRYSELAFNTLKTAKHPDIESWFRFKLDNLGVDSDIYARYIMSVFTKESYPAPTPESRIFPPHFFTKSRSRVKRNRNIVYTERSDMSIAAECLGYVLDSDQVEVLLEELCTRLNNKKNGGSVVKAEPDASTTDVKTISQPEKYQNAFPLLVSSAPQQRMVLPVARAAVRDRSQKPLKFRSTAAATAVKRPILKSSKKNSAKTLASVGRPKCVNFVDLPKVKDSVKKRFPVGFIDKDSTDALLYNNFMASKKNPPTSSGKRNVNNGKEDLSSSSRKFHIEYKPGVKNKIAIDLDGRDISKEPQLVCLIPKLVPRPLVVKVVKADALEHLLPIGLLDDDDELEPEVGSSDWLAHVKSDNFQRIRSPNISALWPGECNQSCWDQSLNKYYTKQNDDYAVVLENIVVHKKLNYSYKAEDTIPHPKPAVIEPLLTSTPGISLQVETFLGGGDCYRHKQRAASVSPVSPTVQYVDQRETDIYKSQEIAQARFINTISPLSSNVSVSSRSSYFSIDDDYNYSTASISSTDDYEVTFPDTPCEQQVEESREVETPVAVLPPAVSEPAVIEPAVSEPVEEVVFNGLPPYFELRYNKLCFFDKSGICRVVNCKYSHDISKVTCLYWMKKMCFKKSHCPYLHGFYTEENGRESPIIAKPKVFKMDLNDFPSL